MAAATEIDPRTSPTPSAPRFSARELSVFLGARCILGRVNLDIAARGVTALVGAPGSGKSAFLRALNRMNETLPDVRTTGRVLLDGDDVYAPGVDVAALRRRVGMVFREAQLFPGTVFDNVAWGLRVGGERRAAMLAERVERALDRTLLLDDLNGRLDVPAASLTAGQQQLLCVARALALEPTVLLLDEPASALDPISTARLEDTLAALRDTVTIVIVTHAVQQAARVSQTPDFFAEGRLVEVVDTSAIFTLPREQATQDYLTGRYG